MRATDSLLYEEEEDEAERIGTLKEESVQGMQRVTTTGVRRRKRLIGCAMLWRQIEGRQAVARYEVFIASFMTFCCLLLC